jgi:hypothetical protein
MIIYDYPESIAEEVVVACFKIKSWYSLGSGEKSLELEYMPYTTRVEFKPFTLK